MLSFDDSLIVVKIFQIFFSLYHFLYIIICFVTYCKCRKQNKKLPHDCIKIIIKKKLNILNMNLFAYFFHHHNHHIFSSNQVIIIFFYSFIIFFCFLSFIHSFIHPRYECLYSQIEIQQKQNINLVCCYFGVCVSMFVFSFPSLLFIIIIIQSFNLIQIDKFL